MAHFIVTVQGELHHLLLEKIEPEVPLNENPVFFAQFNGSHEIYFESEAEWEIWDLVDQACALYAYERNPPEIKKPKFSFKKIFAHKNKRKPKWHDQ